MKAAETVEFVTHSWVAEKYKLIVTGSFFLLMLPERNKSDMSD